jgi:hypothetical protein
MTFVAENGVDIPVSTDDFLDPAPKFLNDSRDFAQLLGVEATFLGYYHFFRLHFGEAKRNAVDGLRD